MVEQAAHDSSDECSSHSGLTCNVERGWVYYNKYPSAGIGRQDKLKIYWYNIVNVQVVFRIKYLFLFTNTHFVVQKMVDNSLRPTSQVVKT